AIAWLLLRFGLRALVGLVVIYDGLLGACYLFPSLLDNPALHIWGPVAINRSDGNSLFYAWVLNYSPFGRIQEFISGVIACQIFASRSGTPVSPAEGRFGLALLIGSFVLLFSTYTGLQTAKGSLYQYIAAISPYVVCASVASIVFCLARYRS